MSGRLRRRLAVSLCILLCLSTRGWAQTAPYFYHGLDYGSQAAITPATIFFNRGFDVDQLGAYPRAFSAVDWDRGFTNSWGVITHPIRAIDRDGGWDVFFHDQINPFTPGRPSNASWYPNYAIHLIGGGASYRYMREWFEAHDTPMPRLTAALVNWSADVINETLEEQYTPHPPSSSVADLLIFDLLSAPLFEVNGVANFFSHTIRVSDWSSQPSLTIPSREVENAGSEMVYKFPLPFTTRVGGMFRQGLDGQLGALAEVGGGNHVGAAAGIVSTDRTVDPLTQRERVKLKFSAGAYWDRNDSLMGSVICEPGRKNDLVVNLYPGVLPGRARKLGAWVLHTHDGQIRFGVAFHQTLGLGVGFGR